jgi:hypothetical protein
VNIQVTPLAADIMSFEEGTLSEEDTIALFQELVNNGMAWTLQGVYGRAAQQLLDAGIITHPDVA